MESGRCIEKKFRCDEDPDCSYDHPDSSDEKDCGKGIDYYLKYNYVVFEII